MHNVVSHNYKEDSEDSDYSPVTRTVRNVNLGLRNLTKKHMDTQHQISENCECLGLPVTNNEKNETPSLDSTEPQPTDDVMPGNPDKASTPSPSPPPLPSLSPLPPNTQSIALDNKPVSKATAMAPATAGVPSLSFHKRKPKPCGKHHRLASQLTTGPPEAENPDSQQNSNKPKSEFVTKEYGIIKRKKARKITCPMCKHGAYSQAEANRHYRLSHPPIKCSKFPQVFNNPCSLRRHFYYHQEQRFLCRNCGRSFPFESDLAAHHMKYRRHPGYMCNHDVNDKICGKFFFSKSDLTKYALTHTGKVHECLECGFTTLDKRYLCAHLYTHSDKLRYTCENCGEKFKHHTQLLRH